ncbi:MAG: SCP-2 sterol transfer family protein [Candidatus Parabeggiatoa sp. nov. 2]|nr:MAG: SCP-2 sterol transfer family protein [Beggiatoa sp. 4572_84]RKZ63003.1 MAG: SCP-2 sterol transfer family protein [Gammaproteobacteria bacterium]
MGAATAADIFSDAWMKDFKKAWNDESEITGPLAEIKFNSTICYGIKDEDNPKGCVVVENGNVTKAGAYSDEEANWDLRATAEEWQNWMTNGIGKADLMLPGWAGGLKFEKGEYMEMMSSPSMWGPFVKSFAVMGKVK